MKLGALFRLELAEEGVDRAMFNCAGETVTSLLVDMLIGGHDLRNSFSLAGHSYDVSRK